MQYKIDMIPQEIATVVPVSQGDTSLRRFEFVITSAGEQIALSATETAEFTQENGARHNCTIQDGKAILDAYADMTANAGQYRCKIKITETGGGVISSAAFILRVEEAPR